MIVTPITEMLGIKYPVFQGGMAWIADGKLAAAVSNGGGLGIIAAGNARGEFLRDDAAEHERLGRVPSQGAFHAGSSFVHYQHEPGLQRGERPCGFCQRGKRSGYGIVQSAAGRSSGPQEPLTDAWIPERRLADGYSAGKRKEDNCSGCFSKNRAIVTGRRNAGGLSLS